MFRRKLDSKKVIVATLFVVFFLVSSLQGAINLTPLDKSIKNEGIEIGDDIMSPISADLNFTDPITGSGVNQTVRVYMENRSSSEDNQEFFTIPSPSDNMYLTYGDLNFTFQNNYTAEHIMEGDSALYPEDDNFYNEYTFDTNENYSYVNIIPGMNLTSYSLDNLIDGQGTDSKFVLNSTNVYGNGMVNFTITTNFTESGLNRAEIAAFLLSLQFNVSHVANLTMKMRNFYTNDWNVVNTTQNINTTLGSYSFDEERIINKNLNFLNESNCAIMQFIFERDDTTEFNVTMFEFDLTTIEVAEVPINDQEYVALEFDLRGASSTVNGFYAWIRTLNLTKAQNAELNISLYRADATIDRTQTLLRSDSSLNPDYTEKIYSYKTQYFGDKLSYFEFDNAITTDLELNNYFIVIKSNVSDFVYHLVGLPWFDHGDDRTDHQLKKTSDDGASWINAKDSSSRQLDASEFKLNVTRGYMPSDFNNSLQIQNITLTDQTIVLTGSSDLKWGLGQWKENDFPVPIVNNSIGLFNISLDWDKDLIKGFLFNVSYHAIAYRVENATTAYEVIYDGIPEWTYNYSLNLNEHKFDNWNLTEFWYLYPEYLTAYNLTNPAAEQQFENTAGEQTLAEDTFYKYVSVSDSIATASGDYLLNLTSANLIHQMHSYINFNGTLWETQGFMYGDNVSVSVDIQNEYGTYPQSGSAKAFLFYPNGTKYLGAELSSSDGEIDDLNNILTYAFDNQTIINITENNVIEGKYKLGYFWTNGSAIGCKQINMYIDSYKINISDCEYYPNFGINILQGTTLDKVLTNYTLLMASVNETTGVSMPDYYYVNKTDIDQSYFIEKYNKVFAVYLKDFLQNETILNPDEKVSIKVDIQNINPVFDLNVRVEAKLVSVANEKWIISEGSSATKEIPRLGEPIGDEKSFDVDLIMPGLGNDKVWKGVNSPVRKGGVKTIVSIYIEDELAGEYESSDYSLIINQTDAEFEGQIIALKLEEEITSKAILKGFERDECLYLPENTTFILNVYDKYYMSSYNQFLEEFSFKIDSQFTEIEINPSEILNGKTFEISSTLISELGDEISSKSVTCQYYSDDSWFTTGTETTDENGTVSFSVNTLQLQNIKNNMTFRLNWAGDQFILSQTENFTVKIVLESDILSSRFVQEKDFIYRNTRSIISITIYNRGTSNLRITDINFDLSLPVEYSIVQIDNIALDKLKPDESTTIKIEVVLGNIADDQLNITATIIAKNVFSNEEITIEQEVSLDILDKQVIDYLVENFIIIMLLLIGLVIVIAYLLSKRLITEIEKPVEEERKKPKRRGPQYVDVSKLPKSEEPSKEEAEEKEKQEKKKSVDLDTLLKKEGLKKKGKKFKK